MRRLYMPLFNYLKIAAIWLCDIVNRLHDPFQFPPTYATSGYVPSLEALFYADLEARFMQPTGEFFYQLPRAIDGGDTALFQGLATGMKVMKGVDVSRQLDFIQTLFHNGTLIRGYFNDGTPNDTASNDSATGMLFFFYAAFRWGTPDVRAKAGALLRIWANSLRAHGWALVDLQGTPTRFGPLDEGVRTDPIRITLLLAILSLATAYDPTFGQDYVDLYKLYRPLLAYPKVKLLWWDKDYDTHRAAIHLHVLYWLTNDKVYKRGLERIWRISEKTQNAWVYTLCSSAIDSQDGSIVGRSLATFDFARRQLGNVESLNPDVHSVKWGDDIRCRYALPFSRRGSQEFFWQRSMFSKDEWVGNQGADTYHSGLDFLVCGWLAHRLGLLT